MNRVVIVLDNGTERTFWLTDWDLKFLREGIANSGKFFSREFGSDSVYVNTPRIYFMKVIAGDDRGEE